MNERGNWVVAVIIHSPCVHGMGWVSKFDDDPPEGSPTGAQHLQDYEDFVVGDYVAVHMTEGTTTDGTHAMDVADDGDGGGSVEGSPVGLGGSVAGGGMVEAAHTSRRADEFRARGLLLLFSLPLLVIMTTEARYLDTKLTM